MLFQRLYNWIKFKTLPTSTLAKNRLFVERDSKHRRIFTNFGLTFRNSKWSNFEMPNIKINFESKYYKFVTWSISSVITLILLTNYTNYYIVHYVYNSLWFFSWICLDALDYSIAYFIWWVVIFISFTIKFTYTYLFVNNFANNTVQKIFESDAVARIHSYPYPVDKLFFRKADLTRLMNTWLIGSDGRNLTVVVTQNLFDSFFNPKSWTRFYNIFLRSFRAMIVLNLTTKKQDVFITLEAVDALTDRYLRQNPYNVNPCYIRPCALVRYLRSFSWFQEWEERRYPKKKYVNFSFTEFLKKLPDPDAETLNAETEKFPFLLKTKTGFFFFNELDYRKLNHYTTNFAELSVLHPFVKNQVMLAKWNRWLYRYSILHRRILKNSHKLTLAKRLLNSGIYDSKFFDKNVWNSEHFDKCANDSTFSSLFNVYYGNFFSLKEHNDFVTNWANNSYTKNQINDLNLLSFYEYSYFWFLKRFYLFNILPNNFIKSTVRFNNNFLTQVLTTTAIKDNNFNNYSLSLSQLSSTHTHLNTLSYSFLNNKNVIDQIYKKFDIEPLLTNFNNKDIQLLLNENMLFTNDNLNFFLQSTSNLTKSNNLKFYNYLNATGYYNKKVDIVFMRSRPQKSDMLPDEILYAKPFEKSAEWASLFK